MLAGGQAGERRPGGRLLPADARRPASGCWANLPKRPMSCARAGCALPLAARRRWPSAPARLGFFERVFDGSEPAETVLAYLKGQIAGRPARAQLSRRRRSSASAGKRPYPLLRHHFGLPTLEATLRGDRADRRGAGAGCDLAGHRPGCAGEFLPPRAAGPAPQGRGRRAGAQRRGLPRAVCRQPARAIIPLLRTYSGTDDFIRLAEMYVETIHNAWCAIPLFWFNQMDGRGPWDLEGSIREHQQVMAWYGERGHPGRAERAAPLGHARCAGCGFCGLGLPVGLQCARVWRAGLHCPADVQQPARAFGRDGPGQDAGGAGADRAAGRAGFPHLAADAHRPAQLPARPDCGARAPGGQRLPADGAPAAHRPRGRAHRGRIMPPPPRM